MDHRRMPTFVLALTVSILFVTARGYAIDAPSLHDVIVGVVVVPANAPAANDALEQFQELLRNEGYETQLFESDSPTTVLTTNEEIGIVVSGDFRPRNGASFSVQAHWDEDSRRFPPPTEPGLAIEQVAFQLIEFIESPSMQDYLYEHRRGLERSRVDMLLDEAWQKYSQAQWRDAIETAQEAIDLPPTDTLHPYYLLAHCPLLC